MRVAAGGLLLVMTGGSDIQGCVRYTRSFCFSDDIYQIASPEGNVIAITAPDGSSTQIGYHETLNLPVAVNDPAGRITAYTYDERGNLISITDPAGYTPATATTPNGCPKP